jgi:paraquat-inducible protein A
MSGAAMTAAKAGLCACHDCGLLSRVSPTTGGQAHCPRCGAVLHARRPDSIARTWALLIAALICYVPANLLPMMKTTSLGVTQADTIMSGVLYFMHHGDWGIAIVILTASIVIPLAKIAALMFLLLSVQFKSRWRPRDRTRLYQITELIGPYSMVDIYVVTIMVALVQMQSLASIQPGPAAVFFGAVVVLTIFAAMSFDPRLIWDAAEEEQGHGQSAKH